MTDVAEFSTIDDTGSLRQGLGVPVAMTANKEMPTLDKHARQFIEMSPMLFISTVGADGRADVSPRGDPAGFVKVIDDCTILIPERLGNRRADTMMNIIENPGQSVGLIFLLPGVEEVVRASGRARVIDDRNALDEMRVCDKVPAHGLLIELDEVFFHCAKAIKRSKLWDPATAVPRSSFPSYAQITKDQRAPERPLADIEADIQESYEKRLY